MTLNFQMDCAVALIVPAAFPWYAFLIDIISWLPVYNLAIIIANSFASVPEFVKNATLRLPGILEAKLSAKSAIALLRYRTVECCKHLVWLTIDSTTSG
uniref:Uncharacterized protein n=1 Tax=Rhizophora mucronata TaxID=61149 RepID=A0A2P2PLH3_RHIMU